MKRECIKKEFHKCISMPAFYALLIMCIGFNLFILYDGLTYKMEAIRYDEALLKADPALFTEAYYYDSYGNLNMQDVRVLAEGNVRYDDITENIIKKQYAKLQARADAMENEERNSLTYTGVDNLHAFLFENYTKAICVESVCVVILILVYSMHYEHLHRTEELVLVSKCGEQIYDIKCMTSAAVSMLFVAMLWLISYGFYFFVVDYSSIWQSDISSGYNAFRRTVNGLYLYYYPCVTWVSFTFRQYFLVNLLVILGILIMVILYINILARKITKTLSLLMSIFIGAALLYIAGNVLHFPNLLEYICKLNPVHLITKCGYWFMDYAPGDTYTVYEWLTLIVWGGAGVIYKNNKVL